MATKQQLKNKITDLKQWLDDNHSEHEARPYNEAELKKSEAQLKQLKNWPIERDTLDIREHQFYNTK